MTAKFKTRFPDLSGSVNAYVGSGTVQLTNYTPSASVINTGLMGDIGRATIYGPDVQDNPFSKFMKSPLARGDSALTGVFEGVKSNSYNPNATDAALFDGTKAAFKSNVMTKNLSRQVRVEVNDRMLRQYAQTEEQAGDMASALMAASNACYLDDMYTACTEYFGGKMRGSANSEFVLTNKTSDAGFAEEMTETLWNITQNKFKFKSTKYNASGYDTKSENCTVIMNKDCVFKTFKKQMADAFNPDYLDIKTDTGYVESFPIPAGKKSAAGKLLAIVADNRAFEITPMPEALSVESFRNPARKSTMYATTYEYALGQNPFFNVAYIYAPSTELEPTS